MKIPTIGSPFVWMEFVKRLPRTMPRWRNEHLAIHQAEQSRLLAEALRPVTSAQLAALSAQQNAMQFGWPFGLWGSCNRNH